MSSLWRDTLRRVLLICVGDWLLSKVRNIEGAGGLGIEGGGYWEIEGGIIFYVVEVHLIR